MVPELSSNEFFQKKGPDPLHGHCEELAEQEDPMTPQHQGTREVCPPPYCPQLDDAPKVACPRHLRQGQAQSC